MQTKTQQTVPEKVTEILGSQPSTWVNGRGTNYEWAIPGTTVNRLASAIVRQLKEIGCTMFDVDGSADPYYWVAIRYTEHAKD